MTTDFLPVSDSTRDWKLILILAFLLSIACSVLITYGLLNEQLSTLTQQQAHLQQATEQLQATLSTPAEDDDQPSVTIEQVQAQLERFQERLLNEIQINRVSDKMLTQQVDNLNQLNDKLMADIKAVVAHNDAVTTQIENTHGVVNDLIQLIEEKAQLMSKIMPPGSITAYSGPVDSEHRQRLVQAGWLVCDGSSYRGEDYAALYAVIGTRYGGQQGSFQVPDFRGVFLRGLDLGRGMDEQRALGHYQGDSNRGHLHSAEIGTSGVHSHIAKTNRDGEHQHRLQAQGYWYTMKDKLERRAMTGDVNDFQEYWTTHAGAHAHTVQIETAGAHQHRLQIGESGGAESRPKNYPVVYLIRF